MTSPPQRVRVTSPRTAARASRPTVGTQEIDAQTRVGEVYMHSLLRTQLRLGITVLAVVIGPLAALPALFVVSPAVHAISVVGLPLAWFLLAIAVYPVLLLAGWWYARRAEQAEADFVDLVDRT